MPEKAGTISYLSLGYAVSVMYVLSPTVQVLLIGIAIAVISSVLSYIVTKTEEPKSVKGALKGMVFGVLGGALFVLWTFEFVFVRYPVLWFGGCFLSGLMGEALVNKAISAANSGIDLGFSLVVKRFLGDKAELKGGNSEKE